MSNEGFLTNLSTAELFFRFCSRYKIQDGKARVLVMREIVRRKKAIYIRDVAPALVGKKVLMVKKGKNESLQ